MLTLVKAKVTILIPASVDFRAKKVTMDKEGVNSLRGHNNPKCT